jgi:hypothetical protein
VIIIVSHSFNNDIDISSLKSAAFDDLRLDRDLSEALSEEVLGGLALAVPTIPGNGDHYGSGRRTRPNLCGVMQITRCLNVSDA